ncbi:MAG: hypothetical protein A2283_24030 [Lentisphaerae bacterium RIFOXYA12_FULL_48_11]|nr:MAG: hypothetical protein A2283_24030 [Lentisphaerae bacterium RIFOXYA12_FULL_48_11]
MKKSIITLFIVCNRVLAGDDYLLIDNATGKTNGPFEIRPYSDIVIEGRTYTLVSNIIPLEIELRNIPSVDFRNTTVRAAVNFSLQACGLTNSPASVILFQKNKITKRTTFSARNINLGELLKIICNTCDLTLIRDRHNQTIILVPNAIASDNIAKAYGMSVASYDETIKNYGSFNKALVNTGVIRRETDMICEFQRDIETMVLYGSPEAFFRFGCAFTILKLEKIDGQQSSGGDAETAPPQK